MVYIHVPFCRHKCAYCDFVSGTNIGLRERYIEAVEREVEMNYGYDYGVDTLYFGGGTPSILSVDEIVRLKEIVGRRYDLSGLKEWSVECNPEDMTEEWLTGLKETGVSRLSVGIQSLDDGQLRWMERRHTAREAQEAMRRAQNVGFENISCDIIFGVPGEGLERTLDGVIGLGVQHISAYQLMMEEHSKITLKGLQGVDEECSFGMYREIVRRMKEAGYEHYEISNWAKPGFRSVHNSGYWAGRSYRGFGPGAHSFDGKMVRRWNVGNTLKYCVRSEKGEVFWEEERLSRKERFNEMVMLGLRTKEGVSIARVNEEFGSKWADEFVEGMRRFEGKVVVDEESVRLTEEGVYVSDMIMAEGMRV